MTESASVEPRLVERPWIVAPLLCLSVLGTAYEIVPASVSPVIAAEMGIAPTAVSWLVSVMLGVAVVASVPAGVLVDRTTSGRSVGYAAALFVLAGIGSWWAARAGSYAGLVTMRLLTGIGFVVVWNVGIEVFGTFRNPATATSVFVASGPVGFAVGQATGPWIADVLGWRAVFLVYPVALVVPAAVYAVVAGRDDRVANPGVAVPDVTEYGRLLRNRTVLLLSALGFLSYSLYLFINSWMPTYLNTRLGVGLAESGALVALFPLMGGLSRATGGLVTDRLLGGRRRPVVFASFLVAIPLLALAAGNRNVLVLSATLAVMGFVVQLSLGLFYSYVPDVLPDRFVTAGVALLTSVSLGGAFSAPLVAGVLIEYTDAYLAAFGYGVAMAVLGSALTLLLSE